MFRWAGCISQDTALWVTLLNSSVPHSSPNCPSPCVVGNPTDFNGATCQRRNFRSRLLVYPNKSGSEVDLNPLCTSLSISKALLLHPNNKRPCAPHRETTGGSAADGTHVVLATQTYHAYSSNVTNTLHTYTAPGAGLLYVLLATHTRDKPRRHILDQNPTFVSPRVFIAGVLFQPIVAERNQLHMLGPDPNFARVSGSGLGRGYSWNIGSGLSLLRINSGGWLALIVGRCPRGVPITVGVIPKKGLFLARCHFLSPRTFSQSLQTSMAVAHCKEECAPKNVFTLQSCRASAQPR